MLGVPDGAWLYTHGAGRIAKNDHFASLTSSKSTARDSVEFSSYFDSSDGRERHAGYQSDEPCWSPPVTEKVWSEDLKWQSFDERPRCDHSRNLFVKRKRHLQELRPHSNSLNVVLKASSNEEILVGRGIAAAADAALQATAAEPLARGMTPDVPNDRVRVHARLFKNPHAEIRVETQSVPPTVSRVATPFLLPLELRLAPSHAHNTNALTSPVTPPKTRRTSKRSTIPWLCSPTIGRSPRANRPNKDLSVPVDGSGGDLGDAAMLEKDREEGANGTGSGEEGPTRRTVNMMSSMQQWMDPDPNQGGKSTEQQASTQQDNVRVDEKKGLHFVLECAKHYGLPVREVRDIRDDFMDCDVGNNGALTYEVFRDYVRSRAGIPPDMPIPNHLLPNGDPEAADRNGDGAVTLDEFLEWSVSTQWSEEMLVPSAASRDLRQVAREQGLKLLDVEHIKKKFDEFDLDGSGEIDEVEFRAVLYKLIQAKEPSDVPLKMIKRYWREIDADNSGAIHFYEFLIWYTTSFLRNGRQFDHGSV